MLRQQRQIRMRIHQLMDTGLFMLAFWLAHSLRYYFPWGRPEIFPFEDFIWLWLVILPAAPLILEWQGFYNRPLLAPRRTAIWPLLKASLLTMVLLIVMQFIVREERAYARAVFPLFGLLSFVLVLAKEELLRLVLRTSFGREPWQKRVILVGDAADTSAIRRQLGGNSGGSIEVLAELGLDEKAADKLMELLHQHSPNGVIVCARPAAFPLVESVLRTCELEGVEAWLVANFFRTQTFRTSLDDFYGVPVVVFRSAPSVSWQVLLKQVMDFTVALLVLVLFWWLFAIIALAIRLTSKGPVLFRQQRCGLHGRPFTMLKFRSMVTDAEQRQHELAAMNEMNGPVFKVTNDPRITPVGRFLRRYSLDELPQFINVLKGEMSLVGPRPLPVREIAQVPNPADRRRLSVKPGLTCLWQICGRNEVRDWQDWVRLDLEYIDNWSLWLDLKILVKTIPAVLRGSGAK